MSQNREKYISSGMWLFYREVIGLILRLAGGLILIKIVGSSNYGLYTLSVSLVSFLCVFPQMGLNVFLVKEGEHYISPALFIMAFLSIAILVSCLILGKVIVKLVGHEQIYTPFIIMLFSVPFSLMRLVPLALLEKKFSFKFIAKTESESQLILVFVSIILAFYGLGAKACALGFISMHIYGCCKFFLVSNIRIDLKDLNKRGIFSILIFGFNYSKFLTVNELKSLILPFIVAPNFSTSVIGYIGFIDKIVENINSFSNIFRRLTVPILSKEPASSNKSIVYLMWLQTFVIGFLLLLIPIFFPVFIKFYMSSALNTIKILAGFLCFTALCKAYNTVPTAYLNIKNRNGLLALILLLQYTASIGVFMLTKDKGIISYGLSQSCVLISLIIFSWQINKFISFRLFYPVLLVLLGVSLSIFYCWLVLLIPLILIDSNSRKIINYGLLTLKNKYLVKFIK